ncbi:MAG: hypothetical protein ABIJ56_02405 [Pseudomonadota bacterium]
MTLMRLFTVIMPMFLFAWGCGDSGSSIVGDALGDGDAADLPAEGDAPVDTPADIPPDASRDDIPAEDVALDDTIVEDLAPDGPADAPEEELPIIEHGECTSREDCGGRPCVRVPDEPGGYWTCVDPETEEATECDAPEIDDCCTSEDCTDGEDGGCFYHEDISCGGPVYMPHNMCFYTECHEDGDCDEDMLCLPKGVYSLLRNSCAYATCKTQLDCVERPGGYCKPLMNPCCPIIAGYFCVDPEVCESDDDCDGGASCVVDRTSGWAVCEHVMCPS